MRKHDTEGRSRATWTDGISRLLDLSWLGCGSLFASVTLVFVLPTVLLMTHARDAKLGVVAFLLLPAAVVLSGVVTMLMAPRWLRPAPGAAVALVRVLVLATLSFLPFHAFVAWWEPEYSLVPTFQVCIAWLCWVAGGLSVSLLRRTSTPCGSLIPATSARPEMEPRASVAPQSTPDSIPLTAVVIGALAGILALPFGIAFLASPLKPKRQYGKGLLIDVGVAAAAIALGVLLTRSLW